MKKMLLALGLLGAVALARPAPADAHVSFSIGLPGFGLFVNAPPPPPVVYAPPAYYGPPPAYYYRPAPVFYGGWGPGRHRGWHGHRGWHRY
jgi:hypothetical protein